MQENVSNKQQLLSTHMSSDWNCRENTFTNRFDVIGRWRILLNRNEHRICLCWRVINHKRCSLTAIGRQRHHLNSLFLSLRRRLQSWNNENENNNLDDEINNRHSCQRSHHLSHETNNNRNEGFVITIACIRTGVSTTPSKTIVNGIQPTEANRLFCCLVDVSEINISIKEINNG